MAYPIPRTFSLNITLDHRTEIERSDETTADAFTAARRAIFLLKNIRFAGFRPNQMVLNDMVKTLDDNRLLTDEFRRHTSRILGDLEGADFPSQDELGIAQTIIEQLEAALSRSQRVRDLIAAEQMVGEMRKAAG